MTKRRTATLFVLVLAVGLLVLFALPTIRGWFGGTGGDRKYEINVQLENVDRVTLHTEDGGPPVYQITFKNGDQIQESAEAFAQRRHDDLSMRPWYFTVLNITSPLNAIWVVIGLGGQVLFAGRLVVQWVASEKQRRSVVPNAFWWMALGGASMLLVYFIWRKDIVGIIGQATGWFIYIRNLYFIYVVRGHEGDKNRR